MTSHEIMLAAHEMAKQAEEQVQRELDELVEPLTDKERSWFWIDFTDYFERKYFT